MKTALLDRTLWDMVTDASGGIAIATEPYAIEQDVASAARTFVGEAYYNTTLGAPYFEQVLGYAPPLSVLKALIVQQALRVPGCFGPVCYISAIAGRTVQGQIQFTDSNGTARVATF